MENKEVGVITLIKEVQTFDSGFVKREFVIKTPGEYPQLIIFEVAKEKIEKFADYNKVGDEVLVSFNVRGSYYEPSKRHFINLQAWHVVKTGDGVNPNQEMPTQAAKLVEESADDLPF